MIARNLALSTFVAAALTVERSAAFVAPPKASSFAPITSTSSNDVGASTSASFLTATNKEYSLQSAVADEIDIVQAATCDENDPECITKPRGATLPWEVHKFGGASLATADLYRTVGDLLIREAQGRGEGSVPTMA